MSDPLDFLLEQQKTARGLKKVETRNPEPDTSETSSKFEDEIGVVVRGRGTQPNRARLSRNGKPNQYCSPASEAEIRDRPRHRPIQGDEYDALTKCEPFGNESELGKM